MHEALCYEKHDAAAVTCHLCRHRCRIASGARGICRVRENRDGTLVSLVYGMVAAEHVDPVEKKPLFHFLPGTLTYSIATVGCNLLCRHCQNHEIAQYTPDASGCVPGRRRTPEDIVRKALESGCRSISYTYTEPTVFLEYALDVARLARRSGLKNIFVTNGYGTPEALDLIAPLLDGVNIDLKGFDDGFYRNITGAGLDGVLQCILDYRRRGVWVEITTLVIPGGNDTAEQLDGIARFIATRLGRDVPWHVSRFFPRYRLTDRPVTPVDVLERAAETGRRHGLHHVYVGNIAAGSENTVCPACGETVIGRSGYRVVDFGLVRGGCRRCGAGLPGVWQEP